MIWIGAIGAGILLIAFIMLELKILARERYHFHIMNFLGSGILVYYAYIINSIVFAVLNAVWALVAIYKVFRIKR